MRCIIVDLEATCWENEERRERMEVSEIERGGLCAATFLLMRRLSEDDILMAERKTFHAQLLDHRRHCAGVQLLDQP